MSKKQVLELLKILNVSDKARRKAEYEHGSIQTRINWDYIAETVEKYYDPKIEKAEKLSQPTEGGE